MSQRWIRIVKTPVGIVGVGLLALIVLLAVFAPILWGDKASVVDTENLLAGPSAQHWFGTDNLGRDLFFRVLVATRLSLMLTLVATALGTVIGLVLGTAPELLGGRLGRLVTALVNVFVAFPGLLLVLVFAVIFGVGARGAVLAIGLAVAPGLARLCQTLIAGVTGLEYVAAARIAGVNRFRIMARHVLPNVAEPLIVNVTITAGAILLSFAGLSFLGLGVQAPEYDWGRLMQDGLSGIFVHPLAALGPGIMVVLAGLAFNLTGEAIAGVFGISTPTRTGTLRAPTVETPVTEVSHDHAADGDLVLDVRDLSVTFPGANGPVRPVRGVSFGIAAGEAVGVVGESGSGKSLTALSIAGLVEEPASIDARHLTFCGTDLLEEPASGQTRDTLLGTSLAVVFQDPGSSLNPALTVGRQLAEVVEVHQGVRRREALARAVDRLRSVRIPSPTRRAGQYPHELSGGMRQRVAIALALALEPRLIVFDEPTTALDVIVQKAVMATIQDLQRENGFTAILISHDLGVVLEATSRVLVMYAGRIVEDQPSRQLLRGDHHPYTEALLGCYADPRADEVVLGGIPGSPPDLSLPQQGCTFAPRCTLAEDICLTVDPPLTPLGAGEAACHVRAARVTEEASVV
jgi:peptide/nickel transport system permease protein